MCSTPTVFQVQVMVEPLPLPIPPPKKITQQKWKDTLLSRIADHVAPSPIRDLFPLGAPGAWPARRRASRWARRSAARGTGRSWRCPARSDSDGFGGHVACGLGPFVQPMGFGSMGIFCPFGAQVVWSPGCWIHLESWLLDSFGALAFGSRMDPGKV